MLSAIRRCTTSATLLRHARRFSNNRDDGGSMMPESREAALIEESRTQMVAEEVPLLSTYTRGDEGRLRLHVTGYNDEGFEVNGAGLLGSIIVMPRIVTLWRVLTLEDVTVESLAVLRLHAPSIKNVVFGTGATARRPADRQVRDFFDQRGMVVEYMTSANALSTFNFINAEDRDAAALLISEKPICNFTNQ